MGSALACFSLSIGLMASGIVPFNFFPHGREVVTAAARLPYGAPVGKPRKLKQLEIAAFETIEELGERRSGSWNVDGIGRRTSK